MIILLKKKGIQSFYQIYISYKKSLNIYTHKFNKTATASFRRKAKIDKKETFFKRAMRAAKIVIQRYSIRSPDNRPGCQLKQVRGEGEGSTGNLFCSANIIRAVLAVIRKGASVSYVWLS